jgi:hypothetical protein
MDFKFLAGVIGAGVLLGPLFGADAPKKRQAVSEDMRQAIAFEHHKDVAAERQARKEARHPSVTYSNGNANRTVEEQPEQGRPVKDPGPPPKKQ